MLDRLTRVQLAIFAVVTVITVVIMAIFYLRLPAALGIGTTLTVWLPKPLLEV